MQQENEVKRGGKRENAGRKPKPEADKKKTTAIRVDDALLNVITCLKTELAERGTPYFYENYEILNDANNVDTLGKAEIRKSFVDKGLSTFDVLLQPHHIETLQNIIALRHAVGISGGCTSYSQTVQEVLEWGLKTYPAFLAGVAGEQND